MKRFHLLLAVVAALSVTVMLGWILNIHALQSVLPGQVTMKFTTALMFFISVLIVLGAGKIISDHKPTPYLLAVIMPLAIVQIFIAVQAETVMLPFAEQDDAIKSVAPGVPSLGTMVSFLLISLAGIVAYATGNPKKVLGVIGPAVAGVGVVALAGYALDLPALYYFVENVSTAMAIHTALGFVLLGLAIREFVYAKD
jgi:hypothetical protein